jgi:hypothetical protein
MRKLLAIIAILGAGLALGALPAAGEPPGIEPGIDNGPNKNAFVIPLQCDGFNDDQLFFVWIPNGRANERFLASGGTQGAPAVGHPIGVDVPVGVQKVPGQGAFDRTVACFAPALQTTVYIMPTGSPAG